MSHLFFCGKVLSRACSEALARCTGIAHCQAQRTLRGNNWCSMQVWGAVRSRAWIAQGLRSPLCARVLQGLRQCRHGMWTGVAKAVAHGSACDALRTTGRNHCRALAPSAWLCRAPASSILAEGAMTLPVTLSGGVLFAS